MNDVLRDPWAQSTVNVGVYGCTRAGKTRFLFQLLHHWSQAGRILSQSPGVLTFLNTVQGEIDKHKGSMPTVATTPEMAVTVREGNSTAFQFIFRDLRGELLSSEIDDLDHVASLKRDGVLVHQVKKCDAFLFFFDPTSSEDPSRIERHHEREIKRARRFIEYILRERGNEHLPILFVVTHRDVWENDPRVGAMADQWLARVNEELRGLYESHLRRYCPESMTDLRLTSARVSSLQDNVEGVIEQVRRLVSDSRKFRAASRHQSAKILAAGILSLAFLALVGGWLVAREQPASTRSSRLAGWTPRTDPEAIRKLEDLERLLASHPPGTRLADAEQAARINRHMRWLASAMESRESSGSHGLSEATWKRMKDRWRETARLITAKAKVSRPSDLPKRVALLAKYLEELPESSLASEDLAEAQHSFWDLARSLVVEQIAEILTRRDAVRSPPSGTLGELISYLESQTQDVRNWTVAGAQARARLMEELRLSRTFCEMLSQGKYEVDLAVEQAALDGTDRRWRNIVLRSPGVPDQPSADGIHLRPDQESKGTVAFTTKQPSYRLTLGVGTPVVCDLAVLTDEKKWKRVHDFELTDQGKRGPLTVLGLPFARRSGDSVAVPLAWEGFRLDLRFSDLPPVPTLLWDAGALINAEKGP